MKILTAVTRNRANILGLFWSLFSKLWLDIIPANFFKFIGVAFFAESARIFRRVLIISEDHRGRSKDTPKSSVWHERRNTKEYDLISCDLPY